MMHGEEFSGGFWCFPREIWLNHLVSALVGREDALFSLSMTCVALNKAIVVKWEIVMEKAATFGSLGILKLGREHGYFWPGGTCNQAALHGHLDMRTTRRVA